MEITISVDKLRERKLLIATPMFGGMCHGQYAKSCSDLANLCQHYGIEFYFFYLFNESLIQRARNYCADEFLRNEKFTHLMFIDSDIGFDPNDVIALLAMSEPGSDKDIICAPYPKKTIAWEKIKAAVDKGYADENPNDLQNFVGDFVFNPVPGQTEIQINEPTEVLEGGTGFMMIQRETFDKWKEAYPEYAYRPDHVRSEHFDGSRMIHAYFHCEICPDTKRLLSEDYFFCQWARKAGMKVWMCPWMRLTHTGSYIFGGSLAHLAAIGVSPTANQKEEMK